MSFQRIFTNKKCYYYCFKYFFNDGKMFDLQIKFSKFSDLEKNIINFMAKNNKSIQFKVFIIGSTKIDRSNEKYFLVYLLLILVLGIFR